MPDIRDLLPQLPWEGPPLPRVFQTIPLYHVTSKSNWEIIQEEGWLQPRSLPPSTQQATGLQEGIYLSTDLDWLEIYEKSAAGAEFSVHPELKKAKVYHLQVGVLLSARLVEDPEFPLYFRITDQPIPLERIKVLKTATLTKAEVGW